MFDRRLITVMLLSFATMLTIRLVFRDDAPKQQQISQQTIQLGVTDSVQSTAYKLPTQEDLQQPANRAVAFAEQDSGTHSLTTVELPLYQATFTSQGGTLQTLRFTKHTNAQNEPLQTIHQINDAHDQAPFLLALEGDTPYTYNFDGQETVENGVRVSYVARSGDWDIRKTFVLHNDSYQIDMGLAFESRTGSPTPIRPRLFVPAPNLPALVRDKAIAVINNAKRTGMEQVTGGKELEQAWVMPELFGVENDYFAHVLVKDERSFTQRGYFKQVSKENVTAIYEGPQITESVSFPMSFYVGPKSLYSLRAVDARLEDLMAFGWLSWFAKMLLQLLQWLYTYIANYGFAIIAMTILLKMLLLPFSLKSGHYMGIQQKIAPRLQALRKKFANDPAQFNQEAGRLYAEHGVSPIAPMMGCLLALPQFPIFFSLYRVLGNSIDLYQAPFFGWITDLSAKDPYYVLPLMVGVMAFAQPFGQAMGQDSKAAVLSYLFPLILVAIFVGLPAGLLLFILTNFLFTLGEQRLRKYLIG